MKTIWMAEEFGDTVRSLGSAQVEEAEIKNYIDSKVSEIRENLKSESYYNRDVRLTEETDVMLVYMIDEEISRVYVDTLAKGLTRREYLRLRRAQA